MFKSIKTGVLALILTGTSILAFAQKKINEGTITYNLVYKLNEEQKAALAGQELPNELKVKFNNGLTKLQMEQGPALINIINDNNNDVGLILVDVPIAQKQYAVKQTKEEVVAFKANISKNKDFKVTDEKQIIGGYNAVKYTYTDDKGAQHELWATKDIVLPNVGPQSYFPGLDAFPVKYTLIQNGIETTSTLKTIDEAKVGIISVDVPAGYEVTTMQAIMSGQ